MQFSEFIDHRLRRVLMCVVFIFIDRRLRCVLMCVVLYICRSPVWDMSEFE